MLSRRLLIGATGAVAAATTTAVTLSGLPAAAHGPQPTPHPSGRRRLDGWARDTWRSMVAMADEDTGLVADNIPATLAGSDRSRNTSPTNIGGYLWSAVVARELKIISGRECDRRVAQTLATLATMAHHEPSGMFYNWYDVVDGSVLTTWPGTSDRVYPFASSVDNGWLGAALMVVREAVPNARRAAGRLFDRMRWDMFYDPLANRPGGLIHGGFYDATPPAGADVFTGNHIGVGLDVWYTNHHYDTTVSETRITTYLGLITGQVPAKNYYTLWRTFPATCDWSWQESQPSGTTRTYFGESVYEGTYTYRGMSIVPGWGGSMFEELMPDVFVPEADWAPRSWGRNHPRHVRAQIEHGLVEARYGYWGFSPSSNPAGGYREYGVDALGLNPDGYLSDQESTNVDAGFGTCREGVNPHPGFGDGVVTPHASFLAMMHAPREAIANLVKIQDELHAYGRGGFLDAAATRSGDLAETHLSLDQAMIMGALGHVLGRDVVRRAFSTRAVARRLKPVIGIEQFGPR